LRFGDARRRLSTSSRGARKAALEGRLEAVLGSQPARGTFVHGWNVRVNQASEGTSILIAEKFQRLQKLFWRLARTGAE
jgi:hypothetical protein